MDVFDIRIKNHLFPDLPKSYSDCVDNALQKAGVRAKPKKRFSVVSVAIAAAAVAASFAVILIGAIVRNQAPENRPGNNVGADVLPTPPVPVASAEPGWDGTTQIIASKDPDERYSDAEAERYGRIILSFLHECGESEPDELWILSVRPLYATLPTDDTESYISNVLVLAQSRFGASDGPDLYCIQGAGDGEVLWGTQDGTVGPCRVLGSFQGQQRWVLFGSNTDANGSLGHIRGCYLTGGGEGTDIEFSAFLSGEDSRKPFETSRHPERLGEYYLTVVMETDLNGVLNRSLLLVTDKSNYAYPIRDNVQKLTVLTAEDAAQIREDLNALTNEPVEPQNGETKIYNLTKQPLDTAEAYTKAVLSWLKRRGQEPEELWLCAAAELAFPEEKPTLEAYLLCLYEFEGETGPELFFYKDGAILWQTTGYDPFCINTVYEPVKQMNLVFGFSPAYDNAPLAMEKGQLTLQIADAGTFADDSTLFYPERPLEELPARLSGSRHPEMMREAFIHPYSKDFTLKGCVFTTKDGREFTAPDGVNVLNLNIPPYE